MSLALNFCDLNGFGIFVGSALGAKVCISMGSREVVAFLTVISVPGLGLFLV